MNESVLTARTVAPGKKIRAAHFQTPFEAQAYDDFYPPVPHGTLSGRPVDFLLIASGLQLIQSSIIRTSRLF